jgi:putative salt-induced outer membrane protein
MRTQIRNSLSLIGTAVLILTSAVSIAQDEEGFSGRVGLGYLATSGNTKTDSLNANFDLWWNRDKWSHSLSGLTIQSSTAGITTADSTSVGWKSNYAINETDYVFGRIAMDSDKFGAYDQQVREAVGYGRRFVDTDVHLLSGEAGIGARQADLRSGLSQDEAILYLGANYRWTISESSEFTQSLGIENGSDNRYTEATSALSATILENFALVLSYTIKSNSKVLPGTKKTDTYTAISLEYAF